MERRDVKHPQWMETMDFFFNKMLPKKFLVFVIATIFCFLGTITGGQWLILAGAYGGLMYAQKITQGLQNGNRNNYNPDRRSGDGNHRGRRIHLDAEESREATHED